MEHTFKLTGLKAGHLDSNGIVYDSKTLEKAIKEWNENESKVIDIYHGEKEDKKINTEFEILGIDSETGEMFLKVKKTMEEKEL